MKNKQISESIGKQNASSTKDEGNHYTESNLMEEMLEQWNQEISFLSYEESLREIDQLLENLQNDKIPVEDLQKYYLKGKVYLEHCQNLLNTVEQEVINLNPETLKEYSDK